MFEILLIVKIILARGSTSFCALVQVQVVKLLSQSHAFQSITLIDVQPFTNYCSMIPGYLANLYVDYEDTIIDLKKLCDAKDEDGRNTVLFINGRVCDIDIDKQLVYLMEVSKTIPYDILSFDIGSATKGLDDVPGAFLYTIPTRPIHDLVLCLDQAELEIIDLAEAPIRVAIVGGGASGVELALSLVGRWRTMLGENDLHVTLVTEEQILLTETAAGRKALKTILVEKGITIMFNATVVEVEEGCLRLMSGMKVPFSYCLWATGAGCHDLARTLQQHGLNATQDGWIDVHDSLQSTSHPNIFAAGDCCFSSLLELPKAGTYAVQEGPILARNLERYALHQSLDNFHPEANACLQFLSCGDGTALGFVFGIPLRGKWVWQIKSAMDREFLSLVSTENKQTSAPATEDNILPPREAAGLLHHIDIVNYRQAWATLQHMTIIKDYRARVMGHYVRNHEDEGDEAVYDYISPHPVQKAS